MTDRFKIKRDSIMSMRKNVSQKGFEESIVLNNHSSFAQSHSNLSDLVSSTEFRVKKNDNFGNIENESDQSGKKPSASDESSQIFKSSSNKSMHNFYKIRMKHSLIVSFLILIPVQNLFLCIVSQFSETVIFYNFYPLKSFKYKKSSKTSFMIFKVVLTHYKNSLFYGI